MKKPIGWKGESRRHSLARKGVKTVIDDKHRLAVNNFVARGTDIYNIKPINYDELMDDITKYQLKQKMIYHFTLELEQELKKLEGKKITKRIENYLREKFPNHQVYLQNNYGWWEIEVRIPNMPVADTHQKWMLRYDNEHDLTINVDRYKELNQWAYLEKERSEELEKAIPNLKKAVQQYNRGAEMINQSRDVGVYDGYKDIYPISKYFSGYRGEK